MKKSEYEALIKRETDYQDKLSKVIGIPFAIVAMPSWGLAFLLIPVLGPTSVLIALPGAIAFVVAMGAYWLLARRSDKREMSLKRRYDYGKSPDLTD